MSLLKNILKLFKPVKTYTDWKQINRPPKWVIKAYWKNINFGHGDSHQELTWIIKSRHRIYKIVPTGPIGDGINRPLEFYYKHKRKKR